MKNVSKEIKRKIKSYGFTLIEMLIVIVIIGILAAALLPRLNSARGRANDVARKADLQQLAAAMISYNIDKGKYPVCNSTTQGCAISEVASGLIQAGMSSIPADPNTARTFLGVNTCDVAGQYCYSLIKKRGVTDAGFILMTGTETEGGSNFVTNQNITYNTIDITNIKICTKFIQQANINPPTNVNGTCTYDPNGDQLRYIYIQ